jgi:hypothetical protein
MQRQKLAGNKQRRDYEKAKSAEKIIGASAE